MIFQRSKYLAMKPKKSSSQGKPAPFQLCQVERASPVGTSLLSLDVSHSEARRRVTVVTVGWLGWLDCCLDDVGPKVTDRWNEWGEMGLPYFHGIKKWDNWVYITLIIGIIHYYSTPEKNWKRGLPCGNLRAHPQGHVSARKQSAWPIIDGLWNTVVPQIWVFPKIGVGPQKPESAAKLGIRPLTNKENDDFWDENRKNATKIPIYDKQKVITCWQGKTLAHRFVFFWVFCLHLFVFVCCGYIFFH